MASAAQSGVEVHNCVLAGVELKLQHGALGCCSHPPYLAEMHRAIQGTVLRTTPLSGWGTDCPSSWLSLIKL